MFRFILALALFFIIANPAVFKLTRKVFGDMIASTDGLPTQAGVLLHALVFVLLTHFVGRFMSRYADETEKYAEEFEDEKFKDEEYEEEKFEDENYRPNLTPAAY